jgi:hypothetical protein
MPGLSIDPMSAMLSLALAAGVVLSLILKKLETSIMLFFLATSLLASILMLLGNTLIGIFVLLVYSSLSSALLFMTRIVKK